MPEFKDLPEDFCCPYHQGCPYLEGLPTGWVWEERQCSAFMEGDYERQLEQLHHQLDEQRRQCTQAELEIQQLKAQLHALHRRQFKGRRTPAAPVSECASTQRKKRGAPV